MAQIDLFHFDYCVFDKFSSITLEVFKQAEEVVLGHFTTSVFIDDILKNGLKIPKYTKNYSNDDMFVNGDDEYIYLTSHFDKIFSVNATKKYGGKEVLLLVSVPIRDLELDNLYNRHKNQGYMLNDIEQIYKELKNPGAAQARIRKNISPENIIKVIDVESKKQLYIKK